MSGLRDPHIVVTRISASPISPTRYQWQVTEGEPQYWFTYSGGGPAFHNERRRWYGSTKRSSLWAARRWAKRATRGDAPLSESHIERVS